MMSTNASLSIGYVPHGPNLDRPMDRRRFPRYAAMRGLSFDVVSGWENHAAIVLTPAADVTHWVNAMPDRRIVVDLPDAFLEERQGPKQAVRGLAKWVGGESRRPVVSYLRALERLLERADAIVCSTDEQATNISRYNRNVHPILDLHGEFEFVPPTTRQSDRFDIVWEGLTATLPAVRQMVPALRALARSRQLRLHLVTDLEAPKYMNRFVVRRTEEMVADWGIDVRLYQWTIEKLTEVAGSCDLAIVPVDLTDPLAVGKPENRMRIFWRLGLPVIVSASPAHIRAADLAGLGDHVVCSTIEEWEEALVELASSPDLRLELASAGQVAARSVYSDESLALRWDRVINSLKR